MKRTIFFLFTLLFLFSATVFAQRTKKVVRPAQKTTTVVSPNAKKLMQANAPLRTTNAAKLQTTRVAQPGLRKADLRSPEQKNNWGAPAGIISSTKKSPSGGRPTTTSYAKMGHTAKQTATETLTELRRGYKSLSMRDLVSALVKGGYTLDEAYKALIDLNYQNGTATATLRATGAAAGPVSLAVQKNTRLNSSSVVNILNAGGYTPEEIIYAARHELRMPADVLLKALKHVNADLAKASGLVQAAYGFTNRNIVRLAKNAGVSAPDLEKLIFVTIRPTASEAAILLEEAAVAHRKIVRILKDKYNTSMRTAAKIMKEQLGVAVDEATDLLKFAYNASAADVAEALMDGARYNYDRAKNALSKAYNMSLSDVVKLLSPWH